MDKTYYEKMLNKNRLMPIIIKNRLAGFITFYVGREGDGDKYIRDDMWKVLDDDKDGSVCFIDQLWSDKDFNNRKFSYITWHKFKKFIYYHFLNVEYIRWNRWKNGEVKVYKKYIRRKNDIHNRVHDCVEAKA